ncbi:MAG TPA: CoA-acylating methylmalonate-semialdehyde dehydrogenase [Candidatus Koribacter sp.]|jgi:malonate-semialdehyde dehydrogenase (acetylating)/methylmalonate-semialdehyde dehydrogenase
MSTQVQADLLQVQNFVNGEWRLSNSSDVLEISNPATAEPLARVPLSGAAEVDEAVRAAAAAWPEWRDTPPGERIQYLFKLKQSLEEHFEEISRIVTTENGKTLVEARGDLRRGIENVEVACGIPLMLQGYNLENVSRGIDEIMYRHPLGVVAAITPFNFPAMIPFWYLPYAIATGNCFILKPSERVPLTMQRVFQLIEKIGLPKGVINLVNGGKNAVDAVLDHPEVRAISFVGSTPVARYIYSRAAANGKRVQCQGGAKNYAVILPDADMKVATQIVGESAFGCAGQRCLALSVGVTVGEAQKGFREAVSDFASHLKTGNGLEEGMQMGPVITPESKSRIEQIIDHAVKSGAKAVTDGRGYKPGDYGHGNFVAPTVLDEVPADSDIPQTEIFGPVLSLIHANTLEHAINILSKNAYGNAASLFTTNGAHARRFRHEAPAGNIGINIGVPAPVAYFPFSGWKDSFFGDLHGQGRDAIEFYTDKKVVIERWS